MSGALAIFVKTPGFSALKTRLAATLGAALAEAWYRRAAAAVAEVAVAAGRAFGATVYWAVAEAEALAADAWPTLPNLGQGEGNLGERMGRVHAELVRRHASGLLLGADTPQLDADHLQAALRWCATTEPRQAIGPTHDGGFWLYAANRAVPSAAWEAVAYSRSDTARSLRARFADGGEWLELPVLTDVDRGDDVLRMRRELAALPRPLPAQQTLGVWMEENFGRLGAIGGSS